MSVQRAHVGARHRNRLGDVAPRSIVLVRALQLGDLLCTVPVFRALRSKYPATRISIIGLPWARELIDRLPGYIDELIEFPGFPGISEAPFDPDRLPTFVREMQEREFDVAIQLHGSGLHSNGFVAMLGARRTAGYHPPGVWNPDPDTYTAYPGHGSEVGRYLRLLEFLGIPNAGPELEFQPTEADRAELAALPGMREIGWQPYVCIHPGARQPLRRWPPERFTEVGRSLADAGWRIVLTGLADEASTTAEIAAAIGPQAVDLAGKTSLGALGALIAGARLLVANDTGAAHLADALGTPSVIVFTHTDPERWAAADRALHRVVAGETQASPCRHADGAAHRCLADACTLDERSGVPPVAGDVPVDQVLTEAYDLLAREQTDVA